jgi:hypothetical protein
LKESLKVYAPDAVTVMRRSVALSVKAAESQKENGRQTTGADCATSVSQQVGARSAAASLSFQVRIAPSAEKDSKLLRLNGGQVKRALTTLNELYSLGAEQLQNVALITGLRLKMRFLLLTEVGASAPVVLRRIPFFLPSITLTVTVPRIGASFQRTFSFTGFSKTQVSRRIATGCCAITAISGGTKTEELVLT